ncbi:DUF305 domain-containing protein [Actinoplanes sp. NPDC049668]|uniref:DUF305 domain-containing protein n=1 Tax=unclassified Actinoplanes TaxID=2626549 RepID=UPI0033AB1810
MTLLLVLAALTGCGAEAHRPGPVAGPRAVEVLFARMMVAHHAQAVRLSRILLARTGVPERVHHIAGFIAQDQQRELDEINAWLVAWGHPAADPADPAARRMHGGDAAAHGMLTEDQVREVGSAAPAAAARSFLRQMIAHHAGAIIMARSVLEAGRNRYIRALAAHIVNEQTAENDAMRALLAKPPPPG